MEPTPSAAPGAPQREGGAAVRAGQHFFFKPQNAVHLLCGCDPGTWEEGRREVGSRGWGGGNLCFPLCAGGESGDV